jgi:hypothetical protein
MPSSIRRSNTGEAWKMLWEACRWSERKLGKISAKLLRGNARTKFDRLANHPQTPGLLGGLASNLNIDRSKPRENKKSGEMNAQNDLYFSMLSANPA